MHAEHQLLSALAAQQPENCARALDSDFQSLAPDVLSQLAPATAGRVLAAMRPRQAAKALMSIPKTQRQALMGAMRAGELFLLLRPLPKSQQNEMLGELPSRLAKQLKFQMSFSSAMVGAWMGVDAVTLFNDMTVVAARELISSADNDLESVIPVARRDQRFVGIIRTSELLRHADEHPLEPLIRPSRTALRARADLRSAAAHPGWKDYASLPVTDADGRLLGTLQSRQLQRAQSHQRDKSEAPSESVSDLPDLMMDASWGLLADALDMLLSQPQPFSTEKPKGGKHAG